MKNINTSHQSGKIHIKKGDTVMQIAGKIVDNQNTGKVIRVYPKTYRALVEGLNIISRHTKPNATHPNGGIIKKEAPIHISNLMLIVDGKPSRVGRKENDKGKLQRYSVKTGDFIK
ncbi:MAG: 50S ribosomal protein L24 [Bacteroidetes bacterium]|nr:50S ribosomal protein L24 [Bacteroidota bacterium]